MCSICNKITPDKEECSECKQIVCSDCIKELVLFCECCENLLDFDTSIFNKFNNSIDY